MYGDYSRGHEPDRKRGRNYRRVLLQMGRPVLDSDFAASVDALLGEVRTATRGLSCHSGSPDLGFLVTPGRLLQVFAEAVDRITVRGTPDAWLDYRHRYLGRFPALQIAAGREDALVTLPLAQRPRRGASGQVALWARVERSVKITLNGVAVKLEPDRPDGLTRIEFDVGDATLDPLEIEVPAGATVWLFLLEEAERAGSAPRFWVAPGSYHVDGLIVDADGGGSFPSIAFPESSGFPWDDSPPHDPPLGGLLAPPDLPLGTSLVVYLDVFERHITHVEDPGIREEALGASDTTARSQLVGQVKLATVGALPKGADPADVVRAAFESGDVSGGRLTIEVPETTPTTDPCALPDAAGYSGADNRLYRVEVHRGGVLSEVRLKWSRDNGSELYATQPRDGHLVFAAGTPLAAGDIVEVLSHVVDLGDESLAHVDARGLVLAERAVGELAQLAAVALPSSADEVVFALVDPDDAGRVVMLDERHGDPERSVLKVRRWHGILEPRLVAGDGVALRGPHVLEDAITVELSDDGAYQPGQYWQYEARVRRENANGPWRSEPHGPERMRVPLALLSYQGARLPLELLDWLDERFSHPCDLDADAIAFAGGRVGSSSDTVQEVIEELFENPPLGLFYGGGDRQRGGAGKPLAGPLQVGVARGETPLAGAQVRFEVEQGSGAVFADRTSESDDEPLVDPVTTDERGLAQCVWRLGKENGGIPQIVRAHLLDERGLAIHVPIRFTADFEGSEFAEGIRVTGLRALGGAAPLRNDMPLAANELAEGLRIECNRALSEPSLTDKPTCFVTLEIPYPLSAADRQLWEVGPGVGYQPLRLAARVSVTDPRPGETAPPGSVIAWRPTDQAKTWLTQTLFRILGAANVQEPVLSRLTVKGNFVSGKNERNLYLDGDVFGAGAGAIVNLELPSGDERRGGDLEMWFYLTGAAREVKLAPLERADGSPLSGVRLLAGDSVASLARLTSWAAQPVTIPLSASPSDGSVSFAPPSLNIQVGADRASFEVRTLPGRSGNVVVAAQSPLGAQQATITLVAFSGLLREDGQGPLSGMGVFAGDSVRAVAKLTGVAPRALQVTFSDLVNTTPPAPVPIAAGADQSPGFSVGTTPGLAGELRLTAVVGPMSQAVTLRAVALSPPLRSDGTLLTNATVIAGDAVSIRAQLTGQAPRAANVTFKQVINVQVPSTPVGIAAGADRSADFQLSTSQPGVVGITAVLGPMEQRSEFTALGLLPLVRPDGSSLENITMVRGTSIIARVRLSGAAPRPVEVQLTAQAGLSLSAGRVQIAAGASSGDVTITATSAGVKLLSATLLALTRQATITVVEPKGKDTKEKDTKETKEKDTKETKEKDTKEEKDKDDDKIRKDKDQDFVGRYGDGVEESGPPLEEEELDGGSPEASGRTFIRPADRPAVGAHAREEDEPTA